LRDNCDEFIYYEDLERQEQDDQQMATQLTAQLDASLRDVYETLFLTSNPTCTKAALNLLGHEAGGLRLPLVPATPEETAEVRAMLERHGLLAGAPA